MAEETAAAPAGAEEMDEADAEIAEMQRKVQEMEEEAEKLKQLTDSVEGVDGEYQDPEEVDGRSAYIGQVDYGSTPEELQEHFKACGAISRITILVDKWTGSPKGFAYIEFGDEQAVQNALLLNGSLFRGRQLKVSPKRTNIPGMTKGKKGKGKDKGKGKGKGKYGKSKGKGWYDPYYDPYYAYPYYPPPKGKGYHKGYLPY
eukprot:TRINITY_DN3766_c0_g1_i2.p1 TRINITY_DN3766_c0_g1~~TRINITY_DN3766_c0_g1_i2.p1  ORF type:complete len:202 (+),score=61.43 TRINITY_DN3766_c0_g1_i2:89-694(+)